MITADDVLHDLESRVYNAVQPAHGQRLALACARALAECLYLNFQAKYLYVPTGYYVEADQRHQAIWDDFTGRNHDELSIKYGISKQRVYKIVNAMRKSPKRNRQADLFPEEENDPRPLVLIVLGDYLPAELQRVGLPADESHAVADAIAQHLCASYPGISIRITAALWQKRKGGNLDLFADAC